MQNRILVLFAHPLFENSRIHKSLSRHIPDGVTFHDLYEQYPEFNIDIEREKELLLRHDIIVLQHPIYWYSCPAIMKQWIDVVLEAGWAYGPGGNALAGKSVIQVISTGGAKSTYLPEGFHHNTISEFLLPFTRTAELCKMKYLPPFVVHGSHRLTDTEISVFGSAYRDLLNHLTQGNVESEHLKKYEYLNDWLTEYQKI
jgi:glutathione-regulated potassium-efflux system ancillary protein KefG